MFSIFIILNYKILEKNSIQYIDNIINSILIQTFKKWELFISTNSDEIFNYINQNFNQNNIKLFMNLNDFNLFKDSCNFNFISLYDPNFIWNSDKLNFESKFIINYDLIIHNKFLKNNIISFDNDFINITDFKFDIINFFNTNSITFNKSLPYFFNSNNNLQFILQSKLYGFKICFINKKLFISNSNFIDSFDYQNNLFTNVLTINKYKLFDNYISTVNIFGGLGNQLFQIFTCIAYSIKHNTYFFLPIKYNQPNSGNFKRNFYWNSLFYNLSHRFIINNFNKRFYNIFIEPSFNFNTIPFSNKIYLDGYFQSFKYFINELPLIRKLLNFDLLLSLNRIKYKYLFNDEFITISIHFRRGDYLNLTNQYVILDNKYYINALNYIFKLHNDKKFNILYFCESTDNQQILIDISYINFKLLENDIYKENNISFNFIKVDDNINDLEQFLIMTSCNHNIIANSTFSWWAAFLNNYSDKIILCPCKYFINKNDFNIYDFYPDKWIKIAN